MKTVWVLFHNTFDWEEVVGIFTTKGKALKVLHTMVKNYNRFEIIDYYKRLSDWKKDDTAYIDHPQYDVIEVDKETFRKTYMMPHYTPLSDTSFQDLTYSGSPGLYVEEIELDIIMPALLEGDYFKEY